MKKLTNQITKQYGDTVVFKLQSWSLSITTFISAGNEFLSQFHSGFINFNNQPVFSPVLRRITVINASSAEGVAHCTMEVNSRGKMGGRID